jgi:O-antigen/teichoic acid export membrane protein
VSKVRALSLRQTLSSSLLLNVLVNLLLYLGHLIIARQLPRNDYAVFTVVVSFVSLMALFADLGLTLFFVRKFAEAGVVASSEGVDKRGELLGSMLALRFGMAIIVSIIVLLITPLLGYTIETRHLIMIMLVTLFISSRLLVVRSVGEAFLRGHNKYHLVALFAAIDALVFTSVLYFYSGKILHLEDAVYIYSFCHLPGFLLLFGLVYRNAISIGFHIHSRFDMILSMVREGLPLILSTAFLTIHSQADPLLIDKLSSPREVSAFGAGLRVFSAILYLPGIFAAVIGPAITHATISQDYARIRAVVDRSFRFLLLCALFIAITLSISSNEIVNILFGSNKYSDAAPLVIIFGWSFIPIWFGGFITEIAVAEGKFWITTVYAFVLMVISISGDFILIPSFGALGAVIAKCIAVSIGSIVLFAFFHTLHVLNRKKIFLLFVKLAFVAFFYVIIINGLFLFSINIVAKVVIVLAAITFTSIYLLKIISPREIRDFVSGFFVKTVLKES